MTIIPTKCPVLNNNYTGVNYTTTLEVLVRLSGDPELGAEKVTGIICPLYNAETKKCGFAKENTCHYAEGFKRVEKE